jgi:hypothetical protein
MNIDIATHFTQHPGVAAALMTPAACELGNRLLLLKAIA